MLIRLYWAEMVEVASKSWRRKSRLELCANQCTEAVTRWCSVKKVFLKVSQNSQENTSFGVAFLITL